ncbi:MAG: Rv2578c family radical SAM protein [Demequinaceae bacterium]|nr:Rv2578c family radical SAM protein [Demequinaceae bacterium]
MRWATQEITRETTGTLPGLARLSSLLRSVQTPEFEGITFHEVMAKSALNRVSDASKMPVDWTINPYRGCSHACVYCFARPSHTYLGLNPGRDFESQLIVKVNIVDVLRRDLARPSWKREPVAIGAGTDAYQRAEGKYRLMPGIIAALAESGTPFNVLTKGSVLRRDLPLLADAARDVSVRIGLSIGVFDDEIQRSVEPGTPTTAARLATVTAVRGAGFEPFVYMAPILPFLTDSDEHLDDALRRTKEAGAAAVSYEVLHLRSRVKEGYAAWLKRYHPDLVPRYRRLYGDRSDTPQSYRHELADRLRPLIRAHGLEPNATEPAPASSCETPSVPEPQPVPVLF